MKLYKSEVINDDLSPKWESFNLIYHEKGFNPDDDIVVEVWDFDDEAGDHEDDSLGKCKVNLTKSFNQLTSGEDIEEYDLIIKGKKIGVLVVNNVEPITYFAVEGHERELEFGENDMHELANHNMHHHDRRGNVSQPNRHRRRQRNQQIHMQTVQQQKAMTTLRFGRNQRQRQQVQQVKQSETQSRTRRRPPRAARPSTGTKGSVEHDRRPVDRRNRNPRPNGDGGERKSSAAGDESPISEDGKKDSNRVSSSQRSGEDSDRNRLSSSQRSHGSRERRSGGDSDRPRQSNSSDSKERRSGGSSGRHRQSNSHGRRSSDDSKERRSGGGSDRNRQSRSHGRRSSDDSKERRGGKDNDNDNKIKE